MEVDGAVFASEIRQSFLVLGADGQALVEVTVGLLVVQNRLVQSLR